MTQLADEMASTLNDVINRPSTTPVAAHATKVIGAGTLSTDAATVVSWSSAVFDIDGWWAAGSPTRITVAKTGVYRIGAHVDWTPAGAPGVVTTALYVNGSQLANDGAAAFPFASLPVAQIVSWLVLLSSSDYLEIFATRPAGVSSTLVASCDVFLVGTN